MGTKFDFTMDIGSGGTERRFAKGNKGLKSKLKFSKILNTKVNTAKIKMAVMKPWIEKRMIDLLGFEDELVINFVFTQLEEEEVSGKDMQINLMGFLERDAGLFMTELWELLVGAQKSPNGIPPQFLERKKLEIQQKKAEHEAIQKEIRTKQSEVKAELDREKASIALELARMKEEQDDDDLAPAVREKKKRFDPSAAAKKSRSPERQRKSSRSPERQRKSSRSPERRRKSSRSTERRRSPERRRRDSRSPDRRRRGSRSPRRRSPERRRRDSRSPERRRRDSRSPRGGRNDSPKGSDKDLGPKKDSKKERELRDKAIKSMANDD